MSMKTMIKKLANLALSPLNLEISHKKDNYRYKRQTLRGTLEHARTLGLQPQTVIDVGAAVGTFELYETFPNSKHILIEPLEENRFYLDEVVNKFANIEYVIAAATSSSGSLSINVHPDLDGSSLYLEHEDSNVNGTPRIVPSVTLDQVCSERNLQGPYLIKVDVQGAELDVIAGASKVLHDTDYIVLEVSLFDFFQGGVQLYDVITFMKERGFVVYDIFSYQYRPLDQAMSQVDISFVRESGQFRQHNFYATQEQREALNQRLIKARS